MKQILVALIVYLLSVAVVAAFTLLRTQAQAHTGRALLATVESSALLGVLPVAVYVLWLLAKGRTWG